MATTPIADTDPTENGDTPPETLFVIEGNLSRLTGERGTRNLLKKLRAGSRKKPVGGHRRRSCPTP